MDDVYFEVQPWPLAQGRTFTRAEEQAGKAVCIIGSTVRSNLFPGIDPIGKRFRAGTVSCTVIGLLTSKGMAQYGDQDDLVIMPIKAVERRFLGTTDLRALLVGRDAAYDRSARRRVGEGGVRT